MDAKNNSTAEHRATPGGRVEDDILVRGHGRYVADAPLPNQAYAYFVRSPHASARIVSIDTAAAEKAAGVVGVLTAKDMAGVGNLGRHPPLPGRGGKGLVIPHRPALAGERIMHIGEPVAMVVAETAAAAQDAAELVAVEYEELKPAVDARAAMQEGAPQVWPQAPGNIAVDWPGPNPDPDANAKKVDEIFETAKFVAKVAFTNQRMVGNCMEPRGATARYDAATDSYWTRACSQGAGAMRDGIVAIMNVPKERVRVITEDVGGAFGIKTGPYPENIALLVGAKKFGRPIHWMSTRAEVFLTDNQARDIHSEAELALDDKGKFLALARAQRRQPRRLCGPGRRQHSDGEFYPLPARHVRHQGDRCRRQVRLHQYGPDRAVPRRRPPGSELHPRARGRRSRAPDRHRSGQAAPEKPDQKIGDAVQDRRRHHLRLAAISSRSSMRRSSLPITMASRSAAANRRSAATIAASASAACSSIRAARRSKAPSSVSRATARCC